MTKQVQQSITPTHVIGSTGTADTSDLGYRALDDFKGDLGLGTSLTSLDVSGAAVFNDVGADVDFRVESDTNTHALFVDAGNSRVGINNSSPADELDVTGSVRGSLFHTGRVTEGMSADTWVTFFTLPDETGASWLVTATKRRTDSPDSYMATMIVTKDGANTAGSATLASVGSGVELQLSGADIQARRVSPYDAGGQRQVTVSILRLT